jgi:hypothetical protein
MVLELRVTLRPLSYSVQETHTVQETAEEFRFMVSTAAYLYEFFQY